MKVCAYVGMWCELMLGSFAILRVGEEKDWDYIKSSFSAADCARKKVILSEIALK